MPGVFSDSEENRLIFGNGVNFNGVAKIFFFSCFAFSDVRFGIRDDFSIVAAFRNILFTAASAACFGKAVFGFGVLRFGVFCALQ